MWPRLWKTNLLRQFQALVHRVGHVEINPRWSVVMNEPIILTIALVKQASLHERVTRAKI